MWVLRNTRVRGPPYYLVSGKKHIVGRRGQDLILSGDQSVSRRHATIIVTHTEEDLDKPDSLPSVMILDNVSKFGTYINEGIESTTKIQPDTGVALKSGDRIKFGLMQNEWRLERIPLVVSTSVLTVTEKNELKETIIKLGGHLVGDWNDKCTHLTMFNLTLTVKAVCALASGKPIVIPQYWQRYLEAAVTRCLLPNYEDFIPPLAERALNKSEVSFIVNEKRKTLFAGKLFVFSSTKQFNRLSCMVTSAGGTAVVLEDSGMEKEELNQPHVIVIQYFNDKHSQQSQVPTSFSEIATYLKSQGRRLIPETDIGLAVLYCSVEKHCNPEFDVAGAVLWSKDNYFSLTEAATQPVLALDSQMSSDNAVASVSKENCENTGRKVIPETGFSAKDNKNVPNASTKVLQNEETAGLADMDTDVIKIERLPEPEDIVFRQGTRKRSRKLSDDEDENQVSKRRAPQTETLPSEESFTVNSVIKVEVNDDPCLLQKEQTVKTEPVFDSEEQDLFGFTSEQETSKKRTLSDDGEEEEDMFSFTTESARKKSKHISSDDSVQASKKIMVDDLHNAAPCIRQQRLNVNGTSESSKVCSNGTVKENVRLAGFISKDETLQDDCDVTVNEEAISNELRNKTVIDVKLLVSGGSRRKKSIVASVEEESSPVRNFKNFRKVLPENHRILPHIIGGSDLFKFKGENKGLNDWLQDSVQDSCTEEQANDFQDDWGLASATHLVTSASRR